MTKMRTIDIKLFLSPEDIKRHYRGELKYVITYALSGQSVRLPLSALRSVITPDGIYGVYRIHFTAQGQFTQATKLRDLSPSG